MVGCPGPRDVPVLVWVEELQVAFWHIAREPWPIAMTLTSGLKYCIV